VPGRSEEDAVRHPDDDSAERAALLTAFTNIPSWTAATDAPCGAGWNDYRQGWRGIKCDKPGGRVTHM
jgi:hypothetical protein